ncbi:unnamed protein product [Linum tenue]|uniref:Uncharacterized protein n=1 Tax=Linum tenue TaxID=586396 RepID=A0AAV0NV02_9ROSI|nr:unnamed protein product [Linum tenue]
MGFSAENGKWVISGISLRAPLKPIFTERDAGDGWVDDEKYGSPTTPKSEEARIPARLPCPPPPRKRRATSLKRNCNGGGAREFFVPPDLETVFVCRHVQRAG